MSLISISCLTVVARTSVLCQNESGESRQISLSLPCSWSLRERIQSFPIKYYTNCRVFCSCFLWDWESSPLFLVYWEFLSWMSVEFCQMLFLSQLIRSCDFSSSGSWYDSFYWLIFSIEPALHTWNKSCLAVVYYFLHTLLGGIW